MMTRVLVTIALLCCSIEAYAAEPAEQPLAPISAAEAQERVAESQDFLTDMLWMKTESYWHTGQWDEAIRLCRQIVQIDPHFVEAYNGAAWMLWSMDRDDEAVELYRAGIAANPKSYEIYHDFGMYYMNRKKYDEAAEQFRKSVENGAPMYYQHMLPNALERGGHPKEALEEWRALAKRFPDDPIARRHIAELEAQLKQ
jgi:tetratricopeptide (TPR) repeat protein